MNIEESKLDSYLVYALMMSGTSEWGIKLNEQDKLIYGIERLGLRDIYNLTSKGKQMNMFEEEEESYSINLEEELEILNEAYFNAYLIVTKRTTVAELLKADGEMVFLPFDPEAPETIRMVIDDVIEFFSNEEEYEKCAELLQEKKKLDDI